MPRLPIPGGDESHWGDILNDYLEQIHTPIGGLKANTVNTAQLFIGKHPPPQQLPKLSLLMRRLSWPLTPLQAGKRLRQPRPQAHP